MKLQEIVLSVKNSREIDGKLLGGNVRLLNFLHT